MKLPPGYSHPVTIGTGSFSTVLRARQEKLDRPVALKMIRAGGRANATEIEKEARLLASVVLPCVPRIYDVLRHGSTVTLVMEWIYGIPLSVLIGQSPDTRLRDVVATDIVQALALLHGAGIAHRDLKPDNIIVTPDRGGMFVDFGFSSVAATAAPSASTLRGTPRYMAPELWTKGTAVDFFRADRFSLGRVIEELYGTDLPDPVHELLQTDPADRPGDTGIFAHRWSESTIPPDTAVLPAAITPAAAEYLSQQLVTGARHLAGTGNRTEAYALLTESIDLWPDNTEAITLLNRQFSSPLQQDRKMRILWRSTAAAGITAAIFGAYLFGIRSNRVPSMHSYGQIADNEDQFLALSVPGTGQRSAPAATARFRTGTGAGNKDLTGTIRVLVPSSRQGALRFDGRTISFPPEERADIVATAGTHRVEWIDSAAAVSFGETVDVLPFATTTVSFRSKVHHD